MSRLDERQIADAVANAGRSSVDPRETRLSGAADLSPAAIEARRKTKDAGGGEGGPTGFELYQRARRVFDRAQQLQRTAERRPPGKRRQAALRKAGDALVSAAAMIRLAQATPLDRPYLHALALDKVQTIEAEVHHAAGEDIAALAVDTHRRINDQKHRIGVERSI